MTLPFHAFSRSDTLLVGMLLTAHLGHVVRKFEQGWRRIAAGEHEFATRFAGVHGIFHGASGKSVRVHRV